MNNDLVLHKSIDITAPIAKVWDTLVNPDHIKKYLFGTQTISDWKAGSPISFVGSWEGKEYSDGGTILRIEKEKLLEYTYWSSMSGTADVPENYSTLTFEIAPEGNGTRLTLLQRGFPTQESLDHSASNWAAVMGGLKLVAEGL